MHGVLPGMSSAQAALMTGSRLLLCSALLAASCAADGELDRGAHALDEAPAVLSFAGDWTLDRSSELAAGGSVVINYDLARLPQCFGDVYMAQRTWNTLAFVRWDDQPFTSYSMVECDDARCLDPQSRPLELTVPADAENLEVWFQTSGRSCGVHWDSAFGDNYRFPVEAAAREPAWLGNAAVRISRPSGDACDGGVALAEGFFFGTWARSRATTTNACFEVWEPGVTDYDNDHLWQELDVRVHFRFDSSAPFQEQYVRFDRRVGNNARYAWDLRSIDPFAYLNCPTGPTYEDDVYVYADLELYFSVNGATLRPEGGADAVYTGRFQDHRENPWRDANCQP